MKEEKKYLEKTYSKEEVRELAREAFLLAKSRKTIQGITAWQWFCKNNNLD